ncbi:MAG: AAA family ATPase [Thermomonas sp.]|uniref:AAA family ATPase n=1 Tax=Thermomonas sp. TaxID=1971895 RepID=UPI001DEE885F|nr:AAA family ATPase [Thermomonas sp.]MBZ0087186.1 AAA family ATPase [Thermomonas sp.]
MTRIFISGPEVTVTARPRIQTRRASEVEAKPIAWLWQPYLALGKFSMIVGDPGLSKSTLTACIAAHVTTGRVWPDGMTCPSGEALLVNAEDDPADTTRPRLDAAGAAVDRIHFLDAVKVDQRERSFNLSDVDAIDEFIDRHPQVRLVVIDPISAYLAGVDSHKNADVRGMLAPMSALAAKRGVAVIGVSHLNKGQAAAIYRSSGSLAFVAAARSVYLLAKSDDAPDRRVLLPVKNNLGPDTHGIGYSLRTTDAKVPYVEWSSEPVQQTADEILKSGSDEQRTATEDCMDWLRAILVGDEVLAIEVMNAAKELGFSPKILRRAREKLGVRTRKDGVRGGWIWWL